MRHHNIPVLLLLLLCCVAGKSQPLQGLIPFRDGNLWGYADTNGHVKIKPQWFMAEFFHNGRALVYDTSRRRGYISSKGQYLIAPWRKFGSYDNGTGDLFTTWDKARLNALGKNGKYGIIDSDGHELIPCIYDGEGCFTWSEARHCYIAVIKKNGKYGIIDNANRTLIPFQYEGLSGPFDNWTPSRYYVCKKNGKEGVIDTGNRVIIPHLYEHIEFSDKTVTKGIRATKNGRTIILDTNGKTLIDIPGYSANFPQDSLIPISRVTDNRLVCGLMNYQYQVVVPCEYVGANPGKDTIDIIKGTYDEHHNRIDLYRFLSRKTFQPISGWLSPKMHAALKGYDTSQPKEKPSTMPRYGLKFWVNGKERDEYKKDGISWAVTAQSFFQDAMCFSARGFAPGEDTPSYSAVFDTSGNYVIPPKKTRNNFRIINPTDSIVAIEYPLPPDKLQAIENLEYDPEESPFPPVSIPPYGNDNRLADYNLRTIMPRQQTSIASAFYYGGTFYAIAEQGTFVETVHYSYRLNHVKQIIRTLIGANGKPIPALAQYNIIKYVGSTGNDPMPSSFYSVPGFNKPFIGYFLVADSTRTRGIVDIYGNIKMPAVSFKYTRLDPIGNGIFVAQHTPREQYFDDQKHYEPSNSEPHRTLPNRGEPWLVDHSTTFSLIA